MDIRARVKSLSATRRRVLAGAALGGGLAVAWWLWPRRYPDPLRLDPGEAGFGGWLKIGRDGVVTLAVPQLEMGQGVTSLLAEIAAVELGADWRQMGIEMVPPAEFYANLPLAARWSTMWSEAPKLNADPDDGRVADFAHGAVFSATADGTALAAYELPVREAAATARAMLAMAAAERWDVEPEAVRVADGFVSHAGRKFAFGTLVDDAAGFSPPDPAPLRSEAAAEKPIAGESDAATSRPRIDLPAKADGSLLFAGDIRLPGMVHASIRHAPHGDYELAQIDETAAAGLRGLVGIVRSKRWVAAVAENWWTAERALKAIKPVFAGPHGPDSKVFPQIFAAALDGDEGDSVASFGDAGARLGRPDHSARYTIAAAAHGGIETASATARFAEGKLELWIAAQAPGQARAAAAKAVGLSPRDVVLIPVAAGGSFDARLEARHAIEVAQIARAIGRPVQLTWPRANEFQAVPPRTPVVAELSAAFIPGSGGQVEAWRARIACPPTTREFGARLFGNFTERAALERSRGLVDPLACEGALPPYGIDHVEVEHVPVALDLPTGRLRGNAAAYTAFFTECFIDELAEKAGRDPYLYRIGLLGKSPRMAEILGLATRLAGWDGGGRGSGQGLAMVHMGEAEGSGRIACVAEASLAAGRVTVGKLSAVVDIGRIVNLDIARQQVEGGLIFGMAQAMGGALQFEGGKPVQRSLRDMALPKLAETPEITIEFLPSDAPPCDPGELGVAVAAPAIANALHAATGRRFRQLPLLTETA